MKNLSIFFCLLLVLLYSSTQAQKIKIYQAKVYHFDHSTTKGIVYDVSPQGIVFLDKKAISAMSAKNIQEALSNNQLPRFTVPFDGIHFMNIKRRRSSGRGFGIGYLASFVTLETIMAASILSQDNIGCAGLQQKVSLGDALIGASCAAPPGIFVIGIVSFVGGGLGSLIGSIPVKQISINSINPEMNAREKLKKYALLLQTSR